MSNELQTVLDSVGVFTITMNRPHVHNAFDDKQIIRLTKALIEAQNSEKARIVVIQSQGSSFSAGGDLNYMKRMGMNSYQDNLEDGKQLAALMKALYFHPLPTIAKVQGAAFGGGVGLVCCCDYAIGTPKARFALSEVKLGMAPATIAPYVVRAIGARASRQMFMSGRRTDAQRALQIGLISDLVETDKLDAAVDDLVSDLLNNAPNAIKICKRVVQEVSGGGITEDMIGHTIKMIAEIRESEEAQEGLSAFLAKRPPNW
ncbi:methylglutaconyl-CoA hydratase [Zhongshania antarctica]|uniref:Methylglutaconyl-CoA hydratase n=1 Tax=Zhongshania antarctica TaxID=641702 RepID=A0A840R9G7_9GAMM|nr:enoyl-CoA hydratase-related protein [Zhongshania antarctica]MBB5189002.1 methylglutaconyl-CoA hydratase [Zhongshania antarctica]